MRQFEVEGTAPLDVDRLIKGRPELFDYQDVPDLTNENPGYVAAMAKLQPQWIKDRLAEVERRSKPAADVHLD